MSDRKPRNSQRTSAFYRIRKNIGAALEYIWEVSASIRNLQVDVVIIEGAEKFSRNKIRTLYIGHYENYAFMLNLIYEKYAVTKKHSKIPVMSFYCSAGFIKAHLGSLSRNGSDKNIMFRTHGMRHCQSFVKIPKKQI